MPQPEQYKSVALNTDEESPMVSDNLLRIARAVSTPASRIPSTRVYEHPDLTLAHDFLRTLTSEDLTPDLLEALRTVPDSLLICSSLVSPDSPSIDNRGKEILLSLMAEHIERSLLLDDRPWVELASRGRGAHGEWQKVLSTLSRSWNESGWTREHPTVARMLEKCTQSVQEYHKRPDPSSPAAMAVETLGPAVLYLPDSNVQEVDALAKCAESILDAQTDMRFSPIAWVSAVVQHPHSQKRHWKTAMEIATHHELDAARFEGDAAYNMTPTEGCWDQIYQKPSVLASKWATFGILTHWTGGCREDSEANDWIIKFWLEALDAGYWDQMWKLLQENTKGAIWTAGNVARFAPQILRTRLSSADWAVLLQYLWLDHDDEYAFAALLKNAPHDTVAMWITMARTEGWTDLIRERLASVRSPGEIPYIGFLMDLPEADIQSLLGEDGWTNLLRVIWNHGSRQVFLRALERAPTSALAQLEEKHWDALHLSDIASIRLAAMFARSRVEEPLEQAILEPQTLEQDEARPALR